MAINTQSFNSVDAGPEITEMVANALVTGSPFARSLNRIDSSRGSVAFPTASPAGFDWTTEGAPVPTVDLNDSAVVVAASKLAGVIALTNESFDDSSLPLEDLVAGAIRDSMSAALDDGLLNGDGTPPVPEGILMHESLEETTAADTFRESVILAWGELVAAGADATQVVAFSHPTEVAVELGRELTGGVVHPDSQPTDGFVIGPGIRVVPVAKMPVGSALVVDVSRCYLIVRKDFEVAISPHAGFANDSTHMRVTGRFAVAAPAPGKTLRELDLTGGS